MNFYRAYRLQFIPQLIIILLLCSTAPSHSDVYKTTDSRGNVTFTDTPPAEDSAIKVPLQKTNTQPAATRKYRSKASSSTHIKTRNYALNITSPSNNQRMLPKSGEIKLSVTSSPKLKRHHRFHALLNGTSYGKPSTSTTFSMPIIRTGKNTLNVKVVDENGKAISTAKAVTVFAYRTAPSEQQIKKKTSIE